MEISAPGVHWFLVGLTIRSLSSNEMGRMRLASPWQMSLALIYVTFIQPKTKELDKKTHVH